MLMVKRTNAYDVDAVFKREKYTSNGYTMPYRIYIPKNYDCGEMYPVLIFLHGSGECGCDNEKQLTTLAVQDMFNDIESPVYD